MASDSEFKQYIADLKTPWKTMSPDMDTALAIISRHTSSDHEREAPELMSILESGNDTAIRFPDWQSEVEKIFIHQYGPDNGKYIFKKVVMRLFLISRGTAHHLH